MHAILSYRGYRPTHTPTHKQNRLQYTAPQLARAQCNKLSVASNKNQHYNQGGCVYIL